MCEIKKYEYISFDTTNIYEFDDFIDFSDDINSDNIFIKIDNGKQIVLNLKDGTYINEDGILKTFPFNINFDLDDFRTIKKIIIPISIKQKYIEDLELSKIENIVKVKKIVKGATYNVITNTYE